MRTLVALFCASLFAAPAAHADVDVVVVGAFLGGSVAGGDPSPDGDGVFFGAGVPVINGSGQVAFPCSFTTGSGGTALARGSTAPGDRRIIVRQGDPAPDGNGNFLNFDLASIAINDDGRVVFAGRFTGTFGPPDDTTGVLRRDVGDDHPTLLVRSGQTVDGVKVLSLGNPPPLLNASGEVVFTSLLTGAILLNNGTANTVVVRAGQDAPDASGTINSLFAEPPALNDLGQVAFVPLVVPPGHMGIDEFLRADGPTIVQVVRDGDPAPDHNGTFDLFTTIIVARPPALNASGEIAFVAALAGVTGAGTKGIFRASDPDHVVQIVRRGDATPDSNGSFLDFNFSGDETIAFNDAGQAAFKATLTGTASGSADNFGIFRGDGTTLVRVVRKGQPAPDADGAFAGLEQPAINDAGQVAFHATLAGTTKTEGIFRYDDVSGLIQVVRLGDPLLGSTIARVRFAPDTAFGRKHTGLNASGQVAFQFDLADGREGVAIWTPGSSTTTTTTSSTTTTDIASTTTTIGGTSTTTTTVGTTSSTSSTVGPPSSTTTSTTIATPPPTTLPPCATLRCLIGAARNGPSCAGQTVPPNIARKLDLAIKQAEAAPSQTPRKAQHLYKSAGHLLTKAGKLVTRAAGGRHPKLSTACATGLEHAIGEGAGLVGPPK